MFRSMIRSLLTNGGDTHSFNGVPVHHGNHRGLHNGPPQSRSCHVARRLPAPDDCLSGLPGITASFVLENLALGSTAAEPSSFVVSFCAPRLRNLISLLPVGAGVTPAFIARSSPLVACFPTS